MIRCIFKLLTRIVHTFEISWDLTSYDNLGTTLELSNKNVSSPLNQEQVLLQTLEESVDSWSLRLEKTLRVIEATGPNCGII